MKKAFLEKLVSALMISSILFCLIGCYSESGDAYDVIRPPKPSEPVTEISRLNFVPAIGYYKVNKNLHYCFYIDTEKYWYQYRSGLSFMLESDYDFSLLSSQSALDFIKEVEAIPDGTSESDGPFALKIDMEYKDPDGVTHPVVKRVYGALPENWSNIVKLANELTMQRMEIPDSRRITVVNGSYLSEYHRIREYNYPQGVSLDKIINELGITYEYLYDETLRFQSDHQDVWTLIDKYTFDYLNMTDYSYFDNTQPESSTADELKEYAGKHLDNIISINDVSAVGTFRDYDFEIIRSECFEKWRKDNGVELGQYKYDMGRNLMAYGHESGEETQSCKYFECYIDPSHKYIIVIPDTTAGYNLRNYNIAYDFFRN